MTDLITRIEQAEGPSDELDCRIHLVFNPELELMTDTGGYRNERPVAYTAATEVMGEWRGTWADFASLINTPRYTASIDAALTLADSEDDPLDLLEEALASCRDERDGVAFLPLHICIAALSAKEPSQ